MATILVAALLAAASSTTAIEIEAIPGRGFVATVPVIDANQYERVAGRIKLMATERCGRQNVRFGRYSFDNQMDLDRGVTMIKDFRQNFTCYDPATDPYKPVPADWRASAADVAAATEFATRFLNNLDAGNGRVLATMMDPQLEITAEQMRRFSEDARMHQTGTGSFSGRLEGWLNNPADAAYPGAYVFFAVLSSHPGVAGTCGGILLYRVSEGKYNVSQYDVR